MVDGKRENGYAGFKYDGRWLDVAKKIFKFYKLKNNAKILQIGCDKGFLLHDINKKRIRKRMNFILNKISAINI